MKKILLGIFVFTLAFSFVSFVPKVHAENIFTRFLSFGSKGEDVKALQEVLKNEGLLGAAATGYYGTATKEAVTQLQAKNNLEPVGVVGPKTLALVATKKSTVTSTTTTAKTTTTTTVSTCTVTSPASITVTSPNGGEIYQAGQQVTVTWTSCNVPTTANINIGLSMGSTSIASTAGATPNDGSEVITLPTQANLPTGTYMNYGLNFKVNLFVSGMAVFDASNNLFTINNNGAPICTPTTPASITVTSPNGGEVYTAGQQVMITWTSCNIPNTQPVFINLEGNNNTTFAFVNATQGSLNDGSELVTIPTQNLWQQMQYGQIYKIYLGVGPFGNLVSSTHDGSDNLFTVNNNSTTTVPCLNIAMGTPTYSTNGITGTGTSSSSVTSVAYSIPLTITSMCQTLYLGQSAQLSAIATASNAFAYAFENASTPTTLNTTSSASAVFISSDAVIQDNGYRLENGTTKHFTLSVNLITPSILNSYYRVKLNQIRTFTNSLLTTGATNQNLIPEVNYRTGYQFINN